MLTRRKFIQVVSTAIPAIASKAAMASSERPAAEAGDAQPTVFVLRNDWEFCLDPDAAQKPPENHKWDRVQVPHTWESLGQSQDYSGVAWYRLRFDAQAWWSTQHVRMEFEAVTHTAHVFLNGNAVGEHVGKGYTAFTVDLSPYLKFGVENTLLVRVDNRPGNRMLPRNKSYDWTDDGGIIRPVNLLITPPIFIERVEIDAVPDLNEKTAEVRIRAVVRNAASTVQRASLDALFYPEKESESRDFTRMATVHTDLKACTSTVVELGTATVHNPALWHFDAGNLYVASVEIKTASGAHQFVDTFGIRKFEIRGTAFYLNGEEVSLIGVERMAGSNPDFGMAETTEWIESNHRDMKQLNCVFTRVHWAQDRRVLDFCDRNGILFQEEVPAWGKETFLDLDDEVQLALEQNGLEHLREMIARDRNHPCIVVWGLCNEVDGKNPRSRQFAHAISAEARKLDPSRLQTYASHTLASDPGADMAGDFDFISTNEYYGSWAPGGPAEVTAHMDRIRKAFPNKPLVVSEYGWCECQPKIMAGDDNRVDIIHSHTDAFRDFPEIAGAIYFDYNDYRTLVGDKGVGSMRQRVHGVVDLYGVPKGSFEALRLECSPVERLDVSDSRDGKYIVEIGTRRQLPAYTLRNYQLRWVGYGYDGLPMVGNKLVLPDLPPASTHRIEINLELVGLRRIAIDILRPNGFSTITVEKAELDRFS